MKCYPRRLFIAKKDNYFIAKMDKIRSLVWKNCDGNRTIGEILKLLNNEYPNEENIDQRLFLFIQQMGSLDYLKY